MLSKLLLLSAMGFWPLPWRPAASVPLRVGEPAPPIHLEKLLQASIEGPLSWEDLKGNVVVLEFWGTWCPPCIMSLPHLNVLAYQFKDQPVRFISVTSEDEATVRAFLEKTPVKGWIGLDTDRSMFKAYGIEGIPRTVIVDAEGKVAEITYPLHVTEYDLAELLPADRPESKQRDHGEGVPAGRDSDAPVQARPLFQILIRPSQILFELDSHGETQVNARGMSARAAVALAHRVRATRVVFEPSLAQDRFDIIARVPPRRRELLYPMLQQAVEAAFGVSVRRETRQTDVWLISASTGAPSQLKVSSSHSELVRSPGRLSATRAPLGALASQIEEETQRVTLDETGLEGWYDWTITFDPENTDSLVEAVRSQLGLNIAPASRPIDFLVVEPAADSEERTVNER